MSAEPVMDRSAAGRVVALSMISVVGLSLLLFWALHRYGDRGEVYLQGGTWIEKVFSEDPAKFRVDVDENAKIRRLIEEAGRGSYTRP